MESSQTSAELKFAGRQIESLLEEFTNMKKISRRKGTKNRDTWRELWAMLGTIEQATEFVGKKMEEHTKGEKAALAEVETTGNALAAGTANIVGQIAGSSDAEQSAIKDISQELKVVVAELERHNNERRQKATASNDNLEQT